MTHKLYIYMQRRCIYFVYHAKNNVEQKPPTYPEHPSSYRLLVKHVLLTIRNTPVPTGY